MVLGLGLMTFVTLKLEQILQGKQSEGSDDENRAAFKEQKEKVREWLKAFKSFKLEDNGIISVTSEVAGDLEKNTIYLGADD